MLSEIKNRRKNKIFLENSTKTFKNILLKYNQKDKDKNLSTKQILLNLIQSKIKNVENEENEKEYIVKEVKRNILVKNKMISAFGLRALNHYDDAKNVDIKMKMKIDKYKFFNPLIDSNSKIPNSSRESYFSEKYKSLKIINFPKITKGMIKPNRINSTNKNKCDNSISIIKINEYSFDNKNDISETEPNKSNDSQSVQKILSSFKNNKNNNKENILNICETSNNISEISNKNSYSNLFPIILNTPLTTERNNSNIKNKRINMSFKKKNSVLNYNYLEKIQRIKEKLISEGKKKKKYFENNQYGCDKFKMKYNYLSQKYFDIQ